METNVVFDTHAYIKSMTDAGVEPRAAEAIAHGQIAYLNATAATKTDVANIQRDIEQLRADTKKEIEGLRKDTTVELAKLETRLTSAIDKNKTELTKWFTNNLLAFAGLIIAGMAALLQIFFSWHSP